MTHSYFTLVNAVASAEEDKHSVLEAIVNNGDLTEEEAASIELHAALLGLEAKVDKLVTKTNSL